MSAIAVGVKRGVLIYHNHETSTRWYYGDSDDEVCRVFSNCFVLYLLTLQLRVLFDNEDHSECHEPAANVDRLRPALWLYHEGGHFWSLLPSSNDAPDFTPERNRNGQRSVFQDVTPLFSLHPDSAEYSSAHRASPEFRFTRNSSPVVEQTKTVEDVLRQLYSISPSLKEEAYLDEALKV